VEECLNLQRPCSISPGLSAGAIGDPAAARMGAVMRHGSIHIQTGHKLISQWEPKYISQVIFYNRHAVRKDVHVYVFRFSVGAFKLQLRLEFLICVFV
jgi:hypothetical protein